MADLYVPLDVNAPDDPKILAAGDMGELVFYRSLLLAKRLQSDGFIARGHLRRLGCTPKLAAVLVREDLWVEVEGGFQIGSFLKRNPSRAQVEEQRRAETDRKAAWRAGRDKSATRDKGGTSPPRDAGHAVYATRSELDLDLESESELPPGGAEAPPTDDQLRDLLEPPRSEVVALVAGYVDDYRATHHGQSPVRSWRDQAGQHVKNLLADGVDAADLRACLAAIAKESKSPAVLAHVLADYHQAQEAS